MCLLTRSNITDQASPITMRELSNRAICHLYLYHYNSNWFISTSRYKQRRRHGQMCRWSVSITLGPGDGDGNRTTMMYTVVGPRRQDDGRPITRFLWSKRHGDTDQYTNAIYRQFAAKLWPSLRCPDLADD